MRLIYHILRHKRQFLDLVELAENNLNHIKYLKKRRNGSLACETTPEPRQISGPSGARISRLLNDLFRGSRPSVCFSPVKKIILPSLARSQLKTQSVYFLGISQKRSQDLSLLVTLVLSVGLNFFDASKTTGLGRINANIW